MTAAILTFVSGFCFVVGAFSYLSDDKKIKIEHCLIGIGMGIFGAAIVGISFQGIQNEKAQQTIQKECIDVKN